LRPENFELPGGIGLGLVNLGRQRRDALARNVADEMTELSLVVGQRDVGGHRRHYRPAHNAAAQPERHRERVGCQIPAVLTTEVVTCPMGPRTDREQVRRRSIIETWHWPCTNGGRVILGLPGSVFCDHRDASRLCFPAFRLREAGGHALIHQ
jgi:hypothetical protein